MQTSHMNNYLNNMFLAPWMRSNTNSYLDVYRFQQIMFVVAKWVAVKDLCLFRPGTYTESPDENNEAICIHCQCGSC